MSKVLAIFCADIHLRSASPRSRIDDFQKAQWNKINQLTLLAQKHDCPIICSGDLFDVAKSSNELVLRAIEELPFMYVVPGQHDLPNHRISALNKSSLGVLQGAGKLKVVLEPLELDNFILFPFPFGEEVTCISPNKKKKTLAVTHQLILDSAKSAWSGYDGEVAHTFLDKVSGYDMVLSGDNHVTFVHEIKDKILVNPGSLMRQNSDQVEHKPSVFLWKDCADDPVQQVFLEVESSVLKESNTQSIARFEGSQELYIKLKGLSGQDDSKISFQSNLQHLLKTTPEPTKIFIWESYHSNK